MAKIHDKFVIELAEVIKGYGNDPDVDDPFCLSEFYRFYELPNIAVSRENFEKMRPVEPGRWIPCHPVNDNYLPDLKDDYRMILVTYRTGRAMVRKVKACLCDHGRLEKKVPGIVTAWMPYPDPYVEIEL